MLQTTLFLSETFVDNSDLQITSTYQNFRCVHFLVWITNIKTTMYNSMKLSLKDYYYTKY